MRFLSVDYNFNYINLAMSDETGTIAVDVPPVENQSWLHAVNSIKKLCQENQISVIIVGISLRNQGIVGNKGAVGLEFFEFLKENVDVSVITWEERLPTKFIQRSIGKTLIKRKSRSGKANKNKNTHDSNIKARWILQGYIDRHLMEKEDAEFS